MKKVTFDKVFKILVLLLSVYFLFVLTKIANNLNFQGKLDNLKNGKYQLINSDEAYFIIDSQTGGVFKYNGEEFEEFGHLKEK